MSRRYFRDAGPVKKTRVNHEIRLSPINLVDENNRPVGEIDTREALRMAEEAGLDLVEIQPDVRPPLCKIMDYGKYKYELSKKKQKSSSKGQELKEVRLGRSAKIDPHDVEIRVRQARKFLMEGHKVQLVQQFRGREMAHKEIGLDRLRKISEDLADISKVEAAPKHVGRRVLLMLAPDRSKIEAIKRREESMKRQAAAEAEKAAAAGASGEGAEKGSEPAETKANAKAKAQPKAAEAPAEESVTSKG